MIKKSFFLGGVLLGASILWADDFYLPDLDVVLQSIPSTVNTFSTGDINGDGNTDIFVLENYKVGIIIYGGKPFSKRLDMNSVIQSSITVPPDRYSFGHFFADINGDGKDDLFLSLRTADDPFGPDHDLFWYVIFGSTALPSQIDIVTAADLVIQSPCSRPTLVPKNFPPKGDFDGDKKEDVYFSGSKNGVWSNYLLLGKTVQGQRNIRLDDGVSAIRIHKSGVGLGYFAFSGDVNGDGLTDFVASNSDLGAPQRSGAGQIFIFFGTTVPFSPGAMEWNVDTKPADVTITGAQVNGHIRCRAVEDVVGDGTSDLFIDLYWQSENSTTLWDGRTLLSGGPQVDMALVISETSPVWVDEILTSAYVLRAGDFDGDGKKDIFKNSISQVVEGILSSDMTTSVAQPALQFFGGDDFSLGDINGDGNADLFMGLTGTFAGSIGIIYGYRPLDNPSVQVRSDSIPPKLNLDFDVEGEPIEMKLTGDFSDSVNDRWIPFQPFLPVTLTKTDGAKTIHAVFRNAFGRLSPEAQTSITLNSGISGLAVVDNVIDSPTKLARVDCHVGSPTHVKAAIYDQAGGFIAEVLNGDLAPGVWPLEWDGKNDSGRSVGPGVYYMAIEKEGTYEKKKILVQR